MSDRQGYAAAQAFHTWHSSRTFHAGNPQIDPWMRDVLVALQTCLNTMGKQMDEQADRLDRLEQANQQIVAHLRRQG